MRRALATAIFLSLPAAAAQHIAVLELKNRLPAKLREQFPAEYFTDQIREGALGAVDPEKLQIISRENLLVLLKASGKTLEECEGECEVDTGKRIGADFVVSGELVMVGATVKASLKLHDTHEGNLLAAVTASGRTAEDLDKSLAESIPGLLAPLKKIREVPRAQAAPKAEKPKAAPFLVQKASGPSTLGELAGLARATKLVKDHYYDPSRVDPQRMLDGAVSALAAASAGAIEVDATSVRAGGRTLARPRAADLAGVTPAMQEVGRFLNSALPREDPLLQGAAGEYVAAQGMLQALDPHSTLLPPSIYAEMKTQTRGNFGGVGIVTNVEDGKLHVVRILPSTPAARADLHGGDVITSIDGKSADGIELSDAVSLLRGAPGSQVRLVVERGGKRTPVDLERAVINIEPVRWARLAGDVGYLRLESYSSSAMAKIKEAFTALGPLRGLVFDLRANPGGLLQQAIEISDFFLPGGAIVTTSGAKLKDEKAAKPGDAGETVPLVVLVDGASGSATEITAGALRFNGRAILVGRKTAGRGTVQQLFEQPDGSAVKLTAAQYLVAGVHAVEGTGIQPDLERDTRFEGDPEKDASVSFARQVLLEAKSADRDSLLGAARHLAK